MKKGKALGIGFAVLAAAIVIGIASLPDEVLLESPELEASDNTQSEIMPLDIPPIVVSEEPTEVVEEEPTEVVEEEPTEVVEEDPDDSEGQVIKINIKDGVGGAER